MNERISPMDLRDGLEREVLEPYEPPRMLMRQSNVVDEESVLEYADSRRAWLPKLSMPNRVKPSDSLRQRISKRIARLSSLESNRSSSSMELDSDQQQLQYQQRQLKKQQTTPLISITSNDFSMASAATGDDELGTPMTVGTGVSLSEVPERSASSSIMQRRAEFYRNYQSRSRRAGGVSGLARQASSRERNNDEFEDVDDEDDDEDDAFEDAPLPMPYSTNSTAAGYRLDLFDDRQGMNDSELHIFTKAEKVAAQRRNSLDGSIISELRLANSKRASGGGGGGGMGGGSGSGSKGSRNYMKSSGGSGKSQRLGKRRSKSPTSAAALQAGRRRHGGSRRGILGLMSSLKLTKKHESIARFQLYLLNSGLIPLKTLDRDLASFLPRERLIIKEFQERVKLMRSYDVLSTIEYRFASKYETYVCKHAQLETNQPKNNYKKCIPYDYNRVVLRTLPNVPDSDYINASHVDSCLKPNAYIAAQGPNENTINDFWRMIWEQKTFVIVMLTKVFDFIRVMCNQYWPVELNKPERYGNIEVTLLYEEPLADFVIRTIKIAKLRGTNLRSAAETNAATTTNLGGDQQQQVDGKLETAGGLTASRDSESDASELDDDTDASLEELILNEPGQSFGVRAPRFLRAPRRSATSRQIRDLAQKQPPNEVHPERPASAPRESTRMRSQPQARVETRPKVAPAAASQQPANEFLLHPLFNATKLASSLSSLVSEPNTPMTPRTPSSAGLDRSSATRKAVKKKRREVVKNQRPKRTQFLVPSESQLLDDDDDDGEDDGDGEGDEDGENEDEDGNEATGEANNVDELDAEEDEDEAPENGDGGGRQRARRKSRRKKKRHQPTERIIYQFHYNSWASHTCPFISSLLHFRRRVRICMDEMSKSGRTGPTVVHCNDGCGRTGAYLCIDANLELADEDNVLDIYNYTRKMRQSRKFLIENLEQYKFVYDTIEEAIYCGKTWFPVADLHKRLKQKAQRSPVTRKNEYLLEYEKICRMTSKFSIGDCAGGHRVENREKNRDVSTVPPDNFRPYLSSFQTNDSTDYINAVFVDGYTRSKEYIVTEWPLHRTISDFWSLVYDHDCNSVILLANPSESSTYPSFLPSEKELRRRFGPVFSAEMVSYTHYQNIKSWIYTINKKIVSLTEVIAGVKSETKTTQVFQITCWPQGHRVPTSTNALVELMNMVERWRQRTTYGPVCVVSLNGKSRAGVYCAANVAIEQVVQHSEVDVFNAVKTVRRHRPQLIENMTEYKYCYDLILHYVLHYVNRTGDT